MAGQTDLLAFPSTARPIACTYHRVSTADQDPTLARSELRAAAKAFGLELPPEHEIEEIASGAKTNRPGLERVLELARARKIRDVLVWKLDRFGRSLVDVVINVGHLERAGVRFRCVTQGIDVGPGAGPMGRFAFHVLAAAAELERTLGAERTLLGLAAARARGSVLGRPLGRKDSRQRRRRRV
jgi:putative DNA-invertase from lambdoid prophage Rac